MKTIVKIVTLLLSIALYSCGPQLHYQPASFLSEKESEDFKYDIVRYTARLPKYANEHNKFDTYFDNEYKRIASRQRLEKYYVGEHDTIFFEIVQIAPSLKNKKTATGGKILKNPEGEIIYYEEVYRTWKMTDSLLAVRTPLFFEALIQHQDLTKYYTENINSDTYIEFPNNFVTFDVENRKWISKSNMASNP